MALKAFRKSDGTEIAKGDTVTDFRGGSHVFHAVTRAASPGRSAKIQVGGPFGTEYYNHVIPDLEVREDDGPAVSYENWKFIDSGELDGTQYVDVLDEGDNPIEYGITLTRATESYGPHPVQNISELYG